MTSEGENTEAACWLAMVLMAMDAMILIVSKLKPILAAAFIANP